MIFGLQYALVVAGYAATAFLLGNYMILYTGASQLELGLIFTIQPAVIIVRPIVCSLADRYQAHRAIYLYCSLFSFLCHLPFIVLPFIVVASQEAAVSRSGQSSSLNGLQMNATTSSADIEHTSTNPNQGQHLTIAAKLGAIFTERVRFWMLVVSHFAGCVFFCCMRTLGDVLTVNYCRRMRTNYTKYRKLGPISFGMCSLVLGYINCNETLLGLPDYVSGFILYSACHMTLFVLFYLWPQEYFDIVSEAQVRAHETKQLHGMKRLKPLPSSAEVCQHIKNKILRLICCSRAQRQRLQTTTTKKLTEQQSDAAHLKPEYISTKQQVRIILFLVRQDFRIPLYLFVLVGCGIMGHSVQNFVYVYLAVVCREQHCSSSKISGYIMLGICITETIAYSISNRYFQFHATTKNKLIKVELALSVLATHYLVLAYLVHKSAYYFLVEAVHGFEFGLMIATSIELGDYFANEVCLLVPQLLERRIISDTDDLGLVQVSLIATMLACFLLVYDGLGGIIGGLLFGVVVDRFGFPAAFQLNAYLSVIFLAALLLCSLVAKYAPVKPKILHQNQETLTTMANWKSCSND